MKLLKKKLKFNHLFTAMHFPYNLEGFCTISAKDEVLYEAKNGKVHKDVLELEDYFQGQELVYQTNNLWYLANSLSGQEIYTNIQKLIEKIGNPEPDGSKKYVTDSYSFVVKDKKLQVRSKDGDREVLNQSGFTPEANVVDINQLMELEQGIKTLFLDNPVPKEQLKPGLKLN